MRWWADCKEERRTYLFSTRFDGYGIAELAEADEKVVDFRSRFRSEGEVEYDHFVRPARPFALRRDAAPV